jgi:hypothetical protein
MAIALKIKWVDARVIGYARLTARWNRDEFWPRQASRNIWQPMLAVSLLPAGTNDVRPADGRFAAVLVNADGPG